MIGLRSLLLIFAALFVAREVGAGAMRFRGFPSRRLVIIQQAAPNSESIVKLPPPVAPGMDKPDPVAKHRELPPDLEIEETAATAPVPAKSAEPDAEAIQKLKYKVERERLNQNALRWQEERAAHGSATAMRSLAMRYLTGDGVKKDEVKGMDLLRRGAAGGDSAAQKELAKREPAKKEQL